jgi:hypothetical protein
VALAWFESNRLTETAVRKQSTGTLAPEAGTTYTVRIKRASDDATIRTVSGLTGASYTYTNVDEMADNGGALAAGLVFEVWTVNGSLTSEKFVRKALRP